MLLPMIEGVPVACYPDPANARGVGRTAARYEASIFFATPSFLRLYVNDPKLLSLMFASMRFVASGGEKLAPLERKSFEAKFKRELYEGYSVTESTSLVSINLPDILETRTFSVQKGSKAGTVGMPLPGTAFRIVDPVTMKRLPPGNEGLILIGGAQVMQGYLGEIGHSDSVIFEQDGMRWYKTGDRGSMDEDGFLTIAGRLGNAR